MKELPVVNLNERHFDLGNGQRRIQIFGQPVYFRKNGKYERIENFKLSKNGSDIDNASDDFRVKINKTKISINNNKFEIVGLYLDDTLVQLPQNLDPTFTDSEILFTEIFSGIDIRYTVLPHSVREEIIIKKNPLIGKPFSGDNLYVKYKLTGKLKTKEPYALDANIKPVPYFIESDKKGLPVQALYTYTYPIIVDPTTSPIPTSDATIDYDNMGAYTRYDNTVLLCKQYNYDACGNPATQYTVSYLRFNLTTLAGLTINSATFNIYKNSGTSATTILRAVSSEVDPETGVLTTIANSASSGTAIGNITAGTGYRPAIDVLSHVNTHKGGFCDFGLTCNNGQGTNENFNSSEALANKPYLQIDYSDGGTTYYGIIKRWNGTAWVKAKVKPYVAGSFVTGKKVKRWNGTAWVEVDGTGV